MRSLGSPALLTLISTACSVYVARSRLCRTAGYDAVGTTISLAIAPLLLAGLVTSPAVKLSPNAMNRVRNSRGDGVGVVGGVTSPHAVESAATARIRIAKQRINGDFDHITCAGRTLAGAGRLPVPQDPAPSR